MGDVRMVNLKEIILGKNHEWKRPAIRELDLSRQTYIVMVGAAAGCWSPTSSS